MANLQELKQAINLLKKKKESAQAYVIERYAEVGNRLLSHLKVESHEARAADLEEINEGQRVFHKKLKQMGVVRQVDPSAGCARVLLGKVKMTARLEDLELAQEGQFSGLQETARAFSWPPTGVPPKELNVIGFRVDDAIPLIDKTMDRALVQGEMSLRIIHGFGTGRLREAIRMHLKGVPFVKSVSSADPKLGGDAITMVELS